MVSASIAAGADAGYATGLRAFSAGDGAQGSACGGRLGEIARLGASDGSGCAGRGFYGRKTCER
ncbi:MAG: hypothetical protein AAF199_03530 [Pseudomonadota bacterium]